MKTKDKDLNDEAQSSDDSIIASQSDSVNLLVSIWRGDAPLVISYWVFGFLFTLVFTVFFREIFVEFDNKFVRLLILNFLFFYQIFITVSIWRSCKKYIGKKLYSRLAQVVVILSWFVLFPNYLLAFLKLIRS